MMDAKEIRAWLLQAPKPDSVRTTTADGEVQDLAITKSGSWMGLAETLHALRPELIEALDGNRVLLRALRPLEHEPGPDASRSSAPARAQAVALQQPMDPETMRFQVVANIVAEAYRHATDVAFERLVSLFEAVNRRSESLEHSLESTHKMLKRAWEEQVEAQADAASARVEAEADPLNAVVGAFAQSVAAGQAAKAVDAVKQATKPNGAKSAPNGKA
jgi:hypothetical protein